MVPQIEIIINNCLPYFPKTNPFSCIFILRKVGNDAYHGLQFPVLTSKHEEDIALEMKHYLSAKKFVDELSDGQMRFNEEGGKLKEALTIEKYERKLWWRKNWILITTIITLLLTIIGLIFTILNCKKA